MITRRGLLKGMLGGVGLMVLAPVTSAIPSKPGPVLHIIDEVPSALEIYGRGPAEVAMRMSTREEMWLYRRMIEGLPHAVKLRETGFSEKSRIG